MRRVRVVWIGSLRREEFRPAAAWLSDAAELRTYATPEAAAVKLAAGDWQPEVFLLAIARPGQINVEQTLQLRRLAPLASMVAILGSWCEGEPRTGEPLPGVTRVYWHQWTPRATQELHRLLQGEQPGWNLPATATEAERCEHLPVFQNTAARSGPLVAVDSTDADTAEILCQSITDAGLAAVWFGREREVRVSGVAAIVWDGADSRNVAESLRPLTERFPQAEILALLDFPRLDQCAAIRAAGVSAMLSKPWQNADLLWHLRDALAIPDQQTESARAGVA